MMHGRILFLIAIVLVSSGRVSSAADTLRFDDLPKAVKQGDVCWVRASSPASLRSVYGEFRGEQFPMTFLDPKSSFEGLLGIDMDTRPGAYEIKVVAIDTENRVHWRLRSLKVEKVAFKTQTLSLPPSMVELDPQTLERVNQEARRLQALFRRLREERLWKGAFERPVPGEVTSVFGLRRIINGQPKSSHAGVDLRAEEGTPVLASNGAAVALVDEFFFSGKSVILDHGGGLYSMYFHLSETGVREGDRIARGTMVGRVGSTGRSTAPHLHWGIRLKGARVDPFSLIRLTEHLRE